MERWQIIAHFCTVVTLAALFLQMVFDNYKQRVSRSLEYVAQLHAEPISSDRRNIESALLPYQADLIELNANQGVARSELDRLIFDAVESREKKEPGNSVKISIIQMTLFYDHVVICRTEKICDGRVIDEYFKPQMDEFWDNFETIICDARSAGTTNLGAALEEYLNSTNRNCHSKIAERQP
jgi:hypothetical protein